MHGLALRDMQRFGQAHATRPTSSAALMTARNQKIACPSALTKSHPPTISATAGATPK